MPVGAFVVGCGVGISVGSSVGGSVGKLVGTNVGINVGVVACTMVACKYAIVIGPVECNVGISLTDDAIAASSFVRLDVTFVVTFKTSLSKDPLILATTLTEPALN
jgi:hypothetical protein